MTKNKRLILETIQNSDKHLTADEIYNQIKEINPTISLSTTYRNLSQLETEGYIKRYDLGKSHMIYDKRVYTHAHAVNDLTGEIKDIINPNILKELEKYVDGNILSYDLVIHYKK